MAAYVTYKLKDGVAIPDLDNENAVFADELVTEEDLFALGFEPVDLPVDHGDGKIEEELCFQSPDDSTFLYGPDDLRNFEDYDTDGEEDAAPMDEETAKAILMTETGSLFSPMKYFMNKSMYDFDIHSTEGMKNVLNLLPIMDVQYLQQIASTIWTGADLQDTDPTQLREEVRGYLLDQLHSANSDMG